MSISNLQSIQWETLFSLIQTLAILGGAVWTYRLFKIHRSDIPKANVSHHIFHTPITKTQALLRVAVRLENTGQVAFHTSFMSVWVQQVKPLPQGEMPTTDESTMFLWPVLGEQCAHNPNVAN